jgi:hypothetical protein
MKILPLAMPDEFVLGYWGRIHILNLFRTPNQTVDALIKYFLLSPSRIQRVEALALAAQLDVQTFVQGHTLIPVHRAISQHSTGKAHGAANLHATTRQSWRLLHKPGASFCTECLAEHKSEWGFSYWMRKHQLLGVDWCPEHGVPLNSCSENAFLSSTPSPQKSSIPANRIELGEACWPIMERYSQIMASFLGSTRRVGVQDAARKLRPVAEAKNITTVRSGNIQYLSDIAVRQLPAWWITELFPSINTKQANAPFRPLDNAVLSGYAMPHAYALAMALLYDTSEEALAEFPQ